MGSEHSSCFSFSKRDLCCFSDDNVTEEDVAKELSRILRERYDEAMRLLRDHRAILDRIADALLERETLEAADLALLVAGKPLPRLPFPVEVGADVPAQPSEPERPSRSPGRAIPVPEPVSS